MSIERVVPGCGALVDAVLRDCTNRHSTLHGPAHWRCVAWTGLQLLPDVPGADPATVFLFGVLHDAMRLDDGFDRDHGRRAGQFAASLEGRVIHLGPERLRTLRRACDGHADGGTSGDPTIGVCWDADRLNLWRIGVRPHPKYLSTDAAKREEMIRGAAVLAGQRLDWGEIYTAFRGYEPPAG